MAIYELLDMAEPGAGPPAWTALYGAGLAAYRRRDFAAAISLFRQVLEARPSDRPAHIMLERCSRYLEAPPPEGWEATNAMTAK
jgi:adenylate cyclase